MYFQHDYLFTLRDFFFFIHNMDNASEKNGKAFLLMIFFHKKFQVFLKPGSYFYCVLPQHASDTGRTRPGGENM